MIRVWVHAAHIHSVQLSITILYANVSKATLAIHSLFVQKYVNVSYCLFCLYHSSLFSNFHIKTLFWLFLQTSIHIMPYRIHITSFDSKSVWINELKRSIKCSVPPVMDTPSPCANSPCGANAVCKERNGVGSCACLPEYYGDPYTGCRPECVQNSECDQTRACVNNKCVDPCPGVCPPNASKSLDPEVSNSKHSSIWICVYLKFCSLFQSVLFEIMHQIASVITVLPVILRSLVVELKSVSFSFRMWFGNISEFVISMDINYFSIEPLCFDAIQDPCFHPLVGVTPEIYSKLYPNILFT